MIKKKGLTIQFVPYEEIAKLSSKERIRKLLEIVKEEKIILLEGRLKSDEKSELIAKTMEEINKKFRGVEIDEWAFTDRDEDWIKKIRHFLVNVLLGSRKGLTIIGPASIIKEIKKDPNNIQLLTK
ncbi:DUF2073 domain-containing protein [Candidatus Woesearchaeota archaeon]|nr:DUF2073 domain-containing protein [Candidatus Woesearchaeota archaeon]